MHTKQLRTRTSACLCAIAAALLCLAAQPSTARQGSGVLPDRTHAAGAVSLDGVWQMKDFSRGIGILRQVMLPGRQPRDCFPARVPGTVRTALLEAGEIPDPYYGYDNEKSLWVEDKEWWFFRTFTPSPDAKGRWIDLVFDGTSFQGEVYLNGARLGELRGMLNPHAFDVSAALRIGEENLIAVRLEATPDARMNVTARGLTWDSPRDQLYSVAQCMYGWDWGPHGVPIGLWKPVWLRVSGPLRVDHPYVRSRLGPRGGAVCIIELDVSNASGSPHDAVVAGTIREAASGEEAGEFSGEVSLPPRGSRHMKFELTVEDAKLWWPNGMGEQNLYTLDATVSEGGVPSETARATFGIRELKLVENENVGEFLKSMKKEAGNPYQLGKVVGSYPWTFQVNGRRMFARGGNWIPVDQLLRLGRDRYDRLLALARDAHFNLLRVWGGGLYETDDFYELCDRYGLLAWQEFLSNRSFSRIDRQNFEEGAESAALRLRNHPSLTFWCGGNEFDPDDTGSRAVIDSLASMLSRDDPGREFHRASPYKGDDHYWGVWHGLQPYTMYRVVRPFRSEAGVNAFPVPEDYAKFTPGAMLWPPDTTFIEYHGEYNTRFEHLKKLMRYAGEFGPSASIGGLIMKSELYQALANSFNMEYCRAHKFSNSGLLIWQYNDIWPCVSWSMVDWYGTPKPSYYYQKRASRPVHISADYARYVWKAGEKFAADVNLLNDTESPVSGASYIARILDDSSNVLATSRGPARAAANRSATVGRIRFPIPAGLTGKSFFVSVELSGSGGKMISDALYPIAVSATGETDRYENLFAAMDSMPRADLRVGAVEANATSDRARTCRIEIANPTMRLAFFVRIRLEGESDSLRINYSDNYISLLPGETKTIEVVVEAGGYAPLPGELRFEIAGWNCSSRKVVFPI